MARVLRQLSVAYLLAAGLYSCLIVFHARPELARDLQAGGTRTAQQGVEIAQDAARWAGAEVAVIRQRVSSSLEKRKLPAAPARVSPPRPTAVVSAQPIPTLAPQVAVSAVERNVKPAPLTPNVIVPQHLLRHLPKPMEQAPSFAGAKPEQEVPARPLLSQLQQPELAPPEEPMPSAGEIARVEQRLRANLTSELLGGFDLFLYVSKAERGPWAQRMYVFDKQPSGDLGLQHAWPVSTGRDARVLTNRGWRIALDTPGGYYQLDPGRFYTRYTSAEWGMPMPYAMFLNWVHNGDQTGLAIHGASGEDLALLGTRASAGCIRLAPDHAQELFTLIRSKYRGPVPRFAYDVKTSTMSNDGILWHDRNGELKLSDGYRVLVFIENYGGENVVAMLY